MHTEKLIQKLTQIANQLVAPGKGLLAADESGPTIAKRFRALNIESIEENRRAYRDLLLTTPGIEEFISGVILFDETIYQKTKDGELFGEVLKSKGIIPGIKVDEGTEAFPDSPDEKITKGLEGLPPRLPKYHQLGARFAKWRAVITIGQGIPSIECLNENAKRFTEFAKLCQEAELVPIVESDVLMDGSHTIERCEEATTKILSALFWELKREKVALEALVLKTNMVLSGRECSVQADLEEVARRTVKTLRDRVPAEVAGVVFLSGGQDDILATVRLNEIIKLGPHRWPVTFSYSRALQNSALKTWLGKAENVKAAQDAFYKRTKLNSLAQRGKYVPEME